MLLFLALGRIRGAECYISVMRFSLLVFRHLRLLSFCALTRILRWKDECFYFPIDWTETRLGHYFDFFGGFRNVGLRCAQIYSEVNGLLCFYVRLLTVQHSIRQVSIAMPASLATSAAASPLIHSVRYDLWTMLNVTACLSTDTVFTNFKSY